MEKERGLNRQEDETSCLTALKLPTEIYERATCRNIGNLQQKKLLTSEILGLRLD
jgi:hypothetical protein